MSDEIDMYGGDKHPWGKRHDLHSLFRKYDPCIVRVQVDLPDGGIGNGTAFHIGGGTFATAAHVVRGYDNPTLFQGNTRQDETGWPVTDILYHPDDADVAILVSDLWRDLSVKHTNEERGHSTPASHIEIPEMWGEWIEQSLILTRGIFCGYPVVPRSDGAYKLAASAEIHTDINRYDTSDVHFLVSSTARGGFSGAPFISEFDMLLGIVTEALYDDDSHPYMAVIAIESIYPILEREDVLRGRLEHYLASWSKLHRSLEARLALERQQRSLRSTS
ncbi:trypsin-like peptidase domain-containing protein [Stenotrophomonas maltophilia]|uniref:trypsin-like peptidase domain-containing protein n=1 Tax=Stenotrophomonas maltophilia TaxID=40324 RepID=UPI002E78B5C4|nr:trypsin-like peptidase domain-containing protein [Stenotrophomonas maltophilia]